MGATGSGAAVLAHPKKESDFWWPLATAFGSQRSVQIPVAMLWDTVGQGQAKRSRPPHHRGPAQLPASPAQREEHRQEQEALRAQLEGERLRSQELLRCHTAKRRELQEVAQRERQLLADRLRCAWEKQQALEEQQLKEREQRQRATETRQLLRWKEAELHATKELLQRECDAALRQARELQQLLAQELRSPHRSSRMARPSCRTSSASCAGRRTGSSPPASATSSISWSWRGGCSASTLWGAGRASPSTWKAVLCPAPRTERELWAATVQSRAPVDRL